jgi:hypothetical protein
VVTDLARRRPSASSGICAPEQAPCRPPPVPARTGGPAFWRARARRSQQNRRSRISPPSRAEFERRFGMAHFFARALMTPAVCAGQSDRPTSPAIGFELASMRRNLPSTRAGQAWCRRVFRRQRQVQVRGIRPDRIRGMA